MYILTKKRTFSSLFLSNIYFNTNFIIYKPSVDGTVIARCASEVANSAITAKAGSVVYYQQLT